MQNPYAKYEQQPVMTMTQGDTINLLFDEIVNRLNKGLLGLKVWNYEANNTHFKKAQAAISHLVSVLDHQYPVSQNLASLYKYSSYQILQANVKRSPKPVNEVLPMIMELKETFAQTDKQVRMNHTG